MELPIARVLKGQYVGGQSFVDTTGRREYNNITAK